MILPSAFVDWLPAVWVGLAIWLGLWWLWLTKTTRLQKGLFSAGILISLVLWRSGYPLCPRVVTVRFSKLGTPVEVKRGRMLFPVHYTFRDGRTTWLWTHDDKQKYFGTIVVNDSPETLRLEYVSYSSTPELGFGGSPPTPVAPNTIVNWLSDIDEIGPDDTPPPGMESPIGMGVRAWLTWGEVSSDEP
ncbi:MAG: hypothetical protein ABI183_01935 [Polyangiaceae bacterium]